MRKLSPLEEPILTSNFIISSSFNYFETLDFWILQSTMSDTEQIDFKQFMLDEIELFPEQSLVPTFPLNIWYNKEFFDALDNPHPSYYRFPYLRISIITLLLMGFTSALKEPQSK